eukprot:CAMPEP_0115845244 /NCGR_PEP_ID=MMETSP0287-20121206/9253_1 /TAXON_ID=412157 /ORGANISM="Chrysochromulina rotalis, Strain UIO044" /LENGTH=183 /DNA_ID=CAMNT_0003299013 /DNA_START=147 /DNA_END=698 /DNA_ORIENTATION=-
MGPKRCGKTRISDFLAGQTTAPNLEAYSPTKGARILEFEQVAESGKKSINMQVELWDCSGDRQYESCWPALLRDAVGVVLVYDPTIKEQERDIELWYKTFTSRLGLKDSQVLLFAHQGGTASFRQYQAPRALDRFSFLNTTLDSEEQHKAMKDAFGRFLGGVGTAALEKSSVDLDASFNALGR